MKPCDVRRVAVSVRDRQASLRMTINPASEDYPFVDLYLDKSTGKANVSVTLSPETPSEDLFLELVYLLDAEMVKAAVEWAAAIYKTHAGLD